MAIEMTCDWCGQPIVSAQGGSSRGSVRASLMGGYEDGGLAYEHVGHFHAGRFSDHADSCAAQALDAFRALIGNADPSPASEPEEPELTWSEGRDLWREVPKLGRMRRILEGLGTDALTLSELADRLADQIPGAIVQNSDLQMLCKKLRLLGEVERSPTGGKGSQPKWRYHRAKPSTDLSAFELALREDT